MAQSPIDLHEPGGLGNRGLSSPDATPKAPATAIPAPTGEAVQRQAASQGWLSVTNLKEAENQKQAREEQSLKDFRQLRTDGTSQGTGRLTDGRGAGQTASNRTGSGNSGAQNQATPDGAGSGGLQSKAIPRTVPPANQATSPPGSGTGGTAGIRVQVPNGNGGRGTPAGQSGSGPGTGPGQGGVGPGAGQGGGLSALPIPRTVPPGGAGETAQTGAPSGNSGTPNSGGLTSHPISRFSGPPGGGARNSAPAGAPNGTPGIGVRVPQGGANPNGGITSNPVPRSSGPPGGGAQTSGVPAGNGTGPRVQVPVPGTPRGGTPNTPGGSTPAGRNQPLPPGGRTTPGGEPRIAVPRNPSGNPLPPGARTPTGNVPTRPLPQGPDPSARTTPQAPVTPGRSVGPTQSPRIPNPGQTPQAPMGPGHGRHGVAAAATRSVNAPGNGPIPDRPVTQPAPTATTVLHPKSGRSVVEGHHGRPGTGAGVNGPANGAGRSSGANTGVQAQAATTRQAPAAQSSASPTSQSAARPTGPSAGANTGAGAGVQASVGQEAVRPREGVGEKPAVAPSDPVIVDPKGSRGKNGRSGARAGLLGTLAPVSSRASIATPQRSVGAPIGGSTDSLDARGLVRGEASGALLVPKEPTEARALETAVRPVDSEAEAQENRAARSLIPGAKPDPNADKMLALLLQKTGEGKKKGEGSQEQTTDGRQAGKGKGGAPEGVVLSAAASAVLARAGGTQGAAEAASSVVVPTAAGEAKATGVGQAAEGVQTQTTTSRPETTLLSLLGLLVAALAPKPERERSALLREFWDRLRDRYHPLFLLAVMFLAIVFPLITIFIVFVAK